jgi:CO/xanthine dehydrogenase FAD-binding subunit
VIPPQFDCVRARTVEEAVSALAESGNAKLLAGGQSFLPILRLRLAVAQSWAIVGVAALVRRSGDVIEKARLGLVNMGATPLRATAAEDALAGARADAEAVADAAVLAAEGTRPPSDLSGQADYRRHLARTLTQSAVLAAAGIQTAG